RSVAQSGGGLSCVPYARQATGMAITGNGRDWWHNAAGLYARGSRPEPGSVMAFPDSGGMRSGHVAVVERVVSPREITIHHANWAGPGIRRGTVMRGVSVVDVSEANDWTAVRVQVGHDNATFGRVYPVYGFIHNRPDPTGGTLLAGTTPRGRGVTVVESGRSASLAELRGRYEELAASGETLSPHARQHLDLTRTGMSWGR
ncbi:MAG TPA: CHAP domain-containing protein, partial [Acetobacteraceae bacterium]|nr:CHAP domain-containing protein [Acetobacteraceae bacterium]